MCIAAHTAQKNMSHYAVEIYFEILNTVYIERNSKSVY